MSANVFQKRRVGCMMAKRRFAQIYGKATPEEARGLLEDGIMILPIPILPEELN